MTKHNRRRPQLSVKNVFFNPKNPWIPLFFVFFMSLFLVHLLNPIDQLLIPYSEFKTYLKNDQIKEITFKGRNIYGQFKENVESSKGGPIKKYNNFSGRIPEFEDPELPKLLDSREIKINVLEDKESWGLMLLFNILPWLLIIGLFVYSSKKFRDNMGNLSKGGLPFQKSSAKQFVKGKSSVTFSDVAGLENAKNDLMEIVDFLKSPGKYSKIGAKLPKGVLLMGSPGTGKTLLARATAGEAAIPFYHINGSEFIEVFVGVGASRVRDLFASAKKNAPAIIFIDELDSIGRYRGAGLGGGHDEREQTLNQILSEMDGFEQDRPLVVMAATNRPDILDPALVRPGRFDRQITLDLPHRKARLETLKIHLKDVPTDGSVDLETISSETVGFSGADLKNLVNESALLAARDNKNQVSMKYFSLAKDKILLGHTREERFSEEERKLIAYHESGHALVAALLPKTDPVHKITIIPRGRALGATQQMPVEDRHNYSKSYIEGQICILLGGRIAEEIIFKDVTTGAEDDLKRATRLAKKMVANFGMNDRIGLVSFRQGEEHHFLGKEITQDKDFSEHTAQVIDEEVQKILHSSKESVYELLTKNKDKLDKLANALLEFETLEGDQLKSLLS